MTTFVNVFDQLATIAVNVRKAPSTTLRRMYVKAFRDWCAETQWLRQTVTGATVDGGYWQALEGATAHDNQSTCLRFYVINEIPHIAFMQHLHLHRLFAG